MVGYGCYVRVITSRNHCSAEGESSAPTDFTAAAPAALAVWTASWSGLRVAGA